jgi:hypothetical protein
MVTQPKAYCPNCKLPVDRSTYLPLDRILIIIPCGCRINANTMPQWVQDKLNEIIPMNPTLICPYCKTRESYIYHASVDIYVLNCLHRFPSNHAAISQQINEKESAVATNPQFNKKVQQSYVRLKAAGEEINEVFFNNNINTVFFGETVRDAIAGGLVDNFHAVIWAPDNKYWRNLIFNDLARRFERVNHEYDEEPSFLGQWKFKSKFGDKTVCFYSNRPTPIWSCDNSLFDTNAGVHGELAYLERTLNVKTIDIINKIHVTEKNYEKELLYAAGISAKYGWNIGESSLEHINGIIEQLKPLPEITDSLIVGFRIFAVKNGLLRGYHSTDWPTEKLDAVCEQGKLKQHLQSTDFDRGEHGCGIYIYKDAAEAMNEYKNDAVALVMGWGNAFEGERGWRVEHCRIDKLWIWDAKKRPDRGQYNIAGGIILGTKQGDFFREIYTSGVDFDNTHSNW